VITHYTLFIISNFKREPSGLNICKLKVFSNRLPLVCPYMWWKSFQTSCRAIFIPANFSLQSVRSESFFIHFFISLLYLKPLFPIDKQFSIDAFLDWEGHHWDSCSIYSFRQRSEYQPYYLFSSQITLVGLFFCCLGRVCHFQVWKISPKFKIF